uniref:dUTP diphosphatase n=1 Tax=viral metagenome TaxID=1070528 RepID=A0A6C0BNU2_9ZZZZ
MSPNNMSPNNMSPNNMSPNNMSPNNMSPNNMSSSLNTSSEKSIRKNIDTVKSMTSTPKPEVSIPPSTPKPEVSIPPSTLKPEVSIPPSTLKPEVSIPPSTPSTPSTLKPEVSIPPSTPKPEVSIPPSVKNSNLPPSGKKSDPTHQSTNVETKTVDVSSQKKTTNTTTSKLLVNKLDPNAILPERKSDGAAGYDICCLDKRVVIPPNSRKLISTGLSFTVPEGTYGQLAPRSGMSTMGVNVGAGVIDRDYTGEVKVLLFNHTPEKVYINEKDRIAQLIIKKIELPDVEEVDSLESTNRGNKGFGSTG